MLLLLNVLYLYKLQTPKHIGIITLYSYKAAVKRKESKGTFIEFVMLTYLPCLILVISSFVFKLRVMSFPSTRTYSHHLLCANIVKYITFLYVIVQTIQLYTHCYIQLILKSLKRRKKKKYTFTLSFVITELSLLVFFVDLHFHVGSLAFCLKSFL